MGNATTSAIQIGQVVAGKYRIERVLGEGGMGQVLLATHLDLHEHCAVKVLHRGALGQKDAYERFVREARMTRQLKSQHALKVHDFGRLETGEPYIVMEFLEGVDLRAILLQRGALPVPEAAMYVTQACEAIGEAHALGIVHRDLKPANLFLTKGAHGRPCIKVLDFGIAKMAAPAGSGPEQEMTGSAMIGTLAYMSPEQMLSSRSVDLRADIWSLGVVLFRLVTNKLPFDDDSDGLAILAQVIHGTPAQLSVVDPSLPPGLCAAVACCLQKDREQRYPTAMDLADALSPFVVPEPRSSAARISRWEHTVETSTRRIHPSSPSSSSGVSSSGASSPSPESSDDEKTALFLPTSAPRAPLPAADAQTGASWSRTGRLAPQSRSRLWWIAGSLILAAGLAIAIWRLVRSPEQPISVAVDPTASTPAASTAPATVLSAVTAGSSAPTQSAAIDAPAGPLPGADPVNIGQIAAPKTLTAQPASPRVSKPALVSTSGAAGETPSPAHSNAPVGAPVPSTVSPNNIDPFGSDRR